MKILTIDAGGLHTDTARKFGFEGHESLYWNPWYSAYPLFKDYAPGVGLSKITKVDDFLPYIDECDLIVFPDVGMGDTAAKLREMGYTVFGAGKGEKMETNRKYSIEQMEKYGIVYPKSHFFTGVNEVYEFLEKQFGKKEETNQIKGGKYYAKFDKFRGTLESFPIGSVDDAKQMFGNKHAELGPFAESLPVCLQEAVEGVECGADLFFNGKEFLKPFMWGFESGGDYVGSVTDQMSFFGEDLEKAAKLLRDHDYRGAFSMESIWDGKKHHWLDWTSRFPMPLGLMYSVFNDKLGETFHAIAKGEYATSGLPKGHYLGCSMLSSEEAKDGFLELEGNEHSRFTRFMANKDGKKYSVPGSSLLGMVGSKATDLRKLREEIEKNHEGVSAYFGKLNKRYVDDIEEKYIKPLQKMGIKFGPEDAKEKSSLAGEILKSLKSTKV